jgi:hypothetical protein
MLPLNAGAWQITQQPITQQPSTGNNRTSMPSMPDMSAGPSPMNPARLEKMREEERRKRLLADTARLVQLTNELKEEVDKASRDELSLDVVRKAAEIEKLARDVKDRMKG